MAGKKRVFVTCMGSLYSLSRRQWRRYLVDKAFGRFVDLADYGRRIGLPENVTDLEKEEAQDKLDEFDKEGR